MGHVEGPQTPPPPPQPGLGVSNPASKGYRDPHGCQSVSEKWDSQNHPPHCSQRRVAGTKQGSSHGEIPWHGAVRSSLSPSPIGMPSCRPLPPSPNGTPDTRFLSKSQPITSPKSAHLLRKSAFHRPLSASINLTLALA